MSSTLKIDPMTRIEGHLAIDTRVEGRRVVEAKVAGRMFRGFEQLLVGRHPVDAARIAQRICGICHEVHGVASVLALEDLYRIVPPRNGRVLRDLILGLHLVTDHLFHFYQLSLPDYLSLDVLRAHPGVNEDVRSLLAWSERSSNGFAAGAPAGDLLQDRVLAAELALGYFDAIRVRRTAANGLAVLGGKVPFAHALLPGGITADVQTGDLMHFAGALRETADFVRNRYLPQALALADAYRSWFRIGTGPNNFLCNESFQTLDRPLFRGGVRFADGTAPVFAFSRIHEDVGATYLDADGTVNAAKPGAYSWVKALRYDGRPMEVGPLARQAVNRDPEFLRVLAGFGEQEVRSSVMGRIVARAFEADKICRHLFKLLPEFRPGEPTIHQPELGRPVDGSGFGASIAARGALFHRLEARKGRLTAYRLIVPSAWNFGPAAGSERGVVEASLVGTVVPGESARNSVEVGRIVRSFDPCLACAVH